MKASCLWCPGFGISQVSWDSELRQGNEFLGAGGKGRALTECQMCGRQFMVNARDPLILAVTARAGAATCVFQMRELQLQEDGSCSAPHLHLRSECQSWQPAPCTHLCCAGRAVAGASVWELGRSTSCGEGNVLVGTEQNAPTSPGAGCQ